MTAERQSNREQYPTLAKVVDEFRRVFGPGVKLRHGVEPDGREVGKVPEYLKEPSV